MTRALFPFHDDYPVVDVALTRADGAGTTIRRLLLDTGFTGRSVFVLSTDDETLLSHRPLRDGTVCGALTGSQQRMWVIAGVPRIGFLGSFVAIVTGLGPLGLPSGVQGMAGLTFLQRFRAWGAERGTDGEWRFFLET